MTKLENLLYKISYKGNFKNRVNEYKKKKKEILKLSKDEFECEYLKAMMEETKAKLIILGTIATIIFAIFTDLGKLLFKVIFELEKMRILENNSDLATENMIYLIKGIVILTFFIAILLFYFILKKVVNSIKNATMYRQIKEEYKTNKK